MGKLILLLSLLGTAMLFSLGINDPSNSIMWLASTSVNFTYLRLAMMIVLTFLLVTHPPRNIFLRDVIGAFSICLMGWAVWETWAYAMNVLDLLSILQYGVSTGLIVLESKRFPLETTDDRIIAARKSRLYLQPVRVKTRSF